MSLPSYDSDAEFENPDHEQIKEDSTNSESQQNSHSPWTDDLSLETNMTLSQDDGDLGSDDAIENSDPNTYEGSPVADDGIESENELPLDKLLGMNYATTERMILTCRTANSR